MATLRHKTFVGPTLYLQGGSLNENREVIRAQAEAFANTIGLENVVSVCEHAMSFGPFSVVVWYRAGSAAPEESAVVRVTNAAIAKGMHECSRPARALATADQPAAAGMGKAVGPWIWLIVLLTALVALAVFWVQ